MADALICVDLQNEFVVPGRPLAVPGAQELAGRTTDFADRARAAGARVIWTRYTARHQTPYGASTRRLNLPGLHRDGEAELSAEVQPAPADIILDKPRMSAFYGTDLELILRSWAVDRVLITGLTSHMCCLSTAFDAAARDLETVLVSDLTACPDYRRADGSRIDGTSLTALSLDLVAYGLGTTMDSAAALQSISERVTTA